jgi:hypothetical protein
MPLIQRDLMVVGMQTCKRIQSATWRRRTDKITRHCINCDRKTASHRGKDFCNHCNEFVSVITRKEAKKGDLVRMNFISPLPRRTKNFTPKGGHLFNAPSKAVANRIRDNAGLIQVLKMGETIPEETPRHEIERWIKTNDVPALPRCIPIPDVIEWKADGVCYTPTDN